MNDCNASIVDEHDATASLKGSFGKRTRIIVSLNGVQQDFDAFWVSLRVFVQSCCRPHIASDYISSIMLPPSNFAHFLIFPLVIPEGEGPVKTNGCVVLVRSASFLVLAGRVEVGVGVKARAEPDRVAAAGP
jgi:hypothetical protein